MDFNLDFRKLHLLLFLKVDFGFILWKVTTKNQEAKSYLVFVCWNGLWEMKKKIVINFTKFEQEHEIELAKY